MIKHGARQVGSLVREAATRAVTGTRTRLAGRRTGVVGGVTVVVMASVLVGATPAVARSEKVLQTTNVTVGADGTVTDITSSTLSTSGDKVDKDKTEFDPSKTAAKLPIRVLTSYRYGNETGTDLSDLDGKSGRIEIRVLVQNTTVKPEKLSYVGSDGGSHEQYALVGTPLTVAATATLPQLAVGDIVAQDPTDPSAAFTDGVVSEQDSKGLLKSGVAPTVQWAAILAPPRLEPSTTFTLVVDAHDFTPPSFDISAQPGLITDPSVKALLQRAFGGGGTSQQATVIQTINAIGEFGDVLERAQGFLGILFKNLNRGATELGQNTIAHLTENGEHVRQQTETLAATLGTLEKSVNGSLDTAQTRTNSTVSAAVADVMKNVLGDPGPDQPVAPRNVLASVVPGAECPTAVAGSTLTPKSTVVDVINDVQGKLAELQTSTGACKSKVAQTLQASIAPRGLLIENPNDPDAAPSEAKIATVCQGAPNSAYCILNSAITTVSAPTGALKNALDQGEAKARGDIGAQKVLDLVNTFNSIRQGVQSARSQAATSRSSVEDSVQGLDDLLDTVDSKLNALDASLESVNTFATGRYDNDDLGNALDAIVTAVCDDTVPLTPADALSDYQDQILGRVTGKDCDGDDIDNAPQHNMASRIAENKTAWSTVVTKTASSGAGSVGAAITEVRAAVADLRDAVETMGENSTTSPSFTTPSTLFTIQPIKFDSNKVWKFINETLLGGDANGTADSGVPSMSSTDPCGANGDGPTPEVGAATMVDLYNKLNLVRCQIAYADAGLESTFTSTRTSADGVGATIKDNRDTVRTTQKAVEGETNTMFDAYVALLGNSSTVVTDRLANIRGARTKLTQSVTDVSDKLTDELDRSRGDVTEVVADSTDDTEAAQKQLLEDIANVLKDLGDTKSGQGILGILGGGVTSTSQASSETSLARTDSASFGSLRQLDSDSYDLQKAQFAAAGERLKRFQPFGISLPDGSQLTAVFTFHLKGN